MPDEGPCSAFSATAHGVAPEVRCAGVAEAGPGLVFAGADPSSRAVAATPDFVAPVSVEGVP
ncbi:hypothetical protein, partial [Nocardia niwae]|uniref:hypothetical protein n=1 Tax=Nocardia niwae TaxID=626084 RepID=UPI001C3FB550